MYFYELDDSGEKKFRKSKQGNIDYLQKDCIYLLLIEHEDRTHYIYIKSIEHFANISHNMHDRQRRHCPMCDGKIAHNEYNNNIAKCYKFAKSGTLLSLPKEGDVMEFKNYKNMIERPYIVLCRLRVLTDSNERKI